MNTTLRALLCEVCIIRVLRSAVYLLVNIGGTGAVSQRLNFGEVALLVKAVVNIYRMPAGTVRYHPLFPAVTCRLSIMSQKPAKFKNIKVPVQ